MASLKLFLLSTSLLSLASANPVTEAPLPRLHRRQAAACSSFLDIESSCEAATPSFTDLPLTSQVACLCDPATVFDNAFSSCLRYLSTAEPDLYSSFDNLPSTPCALLNGPSTGPATTTTTTSSSSSSDTDDPNLQACSTLFSLDDDCTSATPRFTDLSASQQASCLCYSGSSFAPEIYDDNRLSCLSYFQSADPPTYQSLVQEGGGIQTSQCSSIGDVRGGATATPGQTGTTRTTAGSTSRTTTSSTARTTAVATSRPSTTSSTSTSDNAAPTGIAGGASMAAAVGALALAILL